jgi:hypothetical protein
MLNKKEDTYNCKRLDFLGRGNRNEKMRFIEKEYNRIKEEKKNEK